MDIYFVRHGETECNRRHVHQSPEIALNERGRVQAHTVGAHLRTYDPDYLITSPYKRARETAEIIGERVGLKPIPYGIFHEVRRPTSLYGKSHFNPATIRYVVHSIARRRDAGWRYGDAENFADVRKRVKDALTHIESLNDRHQSVVVVSHTIFINLIVAYMCKNRVLSLRALLPSLLHVKKTQNGEIIHLRHEHRPTDCDCTWTRVS